MPGDKSVSQYDVINVLTIDVEDYWSVFSRDWLGTDMEPTTRVLENTERFLETLERFNVKGTFFVLGEAAEKFPGLIKKISQAGHEIGSHGISHRQIFKLTEKQFREELAESKKLLEDITSCLVLGYRAPAFSITPETKWALEVLAEEGFNYDSSVFPIAGRRYGWPGFSKSICKVALPSGQNIIEVPLSTVRIFGKDLPIGGGGYMRHFPYVVTKWALKRIQKRRAAVVYMHPYELDIKPRLFEMGHLSEQDKRVATRFHRMQVRNRKTVKGKLIRLLSEFKFSCISEVIKKTAVDSYRIY